jgi:hypothetical protein
MNNAITKFTVPCGDWIFPSHDSKVVPYEIEESLVAEIFVQPSRAGVLVSPSQCINQHLNDTRFLEIEILPNNILYIACVKNTHEETYFHCVDVCIPFDPETLSRSDDLWQGGGYVGEFSLLNRFFHNKSDWVGIFFTSVLLQAYQKGVPLPPGVVFRNASAHEVEALRFWISRESLDSIIPPNDEL